jgi:branched-chain amino acid aminotransferase
LDEHLARLFESAKTSGLQIKKTASELKREIRLCARRHSEENLFLRLGVDDSDSFIFVLKRERPASIYQIGVRLKTSVTRRNHVNASPPEVKSNDFFNNVLANLDKEENIFDVLFLDSKGYVAESTIWNFFIVKDGKLLTPYVGILSGVTREFVLECAEKERFPVIETFITRHDFWNADEAFLTNTSGEIVPVNTLDGRKIGHEIPGKITRKLMKRFQKELNEAQTYGALKSNRRT